MPWLIVRLPWGSMSTHRTRWPFSANAAARLSAVVVFATPPFWFANAITLARFAAGSGVVARSGVTESSDLSGRFSGTASGLRSKRPISQCVFVRARRIPPVRPTRSVHALRDGSDPRQALGLRDRKGGRREDDRGRRPRPRRRDRRQADDRVRGRPAGAPVARLRTQGGRLRRDLPGPRSLRDLDRPRALA